jgi:hypothetical protein
MFLYYYKSVKKGIIMVKVPDFPPPLTSGGNPPSSTNSPKPPNQANSPNSIMPNTSVKKPENPIQRRVAGICESCGALKKQGGPITSLLGRIADKAIAISSTYSRQLDTFNKEIEALKGNKNLSTEERESKIKEIQNKIMACEKEGEAKMDILEKITTKMPILKLLLTEMSDKNIPTDELMTFFESIIQNINSNPSNFSGKTEEKIDEKIKNSALGSNSDKKFEKIKDKIELKLQKLEETSQTFTQPEEKEKTAIEKKALLMELELIESLQSMFKK